MKFRRWSTIGFVVSACALSHCTSSPETGDETHFWCSTDVECRKLGEEYVCRKNECRVATAGAEIGSGGSRSDAGDTGGGGSGGSAAGGQGPAASGGSATGGSGDASAEGSSGGVATATGGAATATGGARATGGATATGGAGGAFPPNVPDPSPGPTVDCNSARPANEASFDTTAGRVGRPQFEVIGLSPSGVQLNGNGTAIVALITTHQIEAGGAEPLIQGQLIRWAGDTISRLGQPPSEGLVPAAVDCAATTITGGTYHPTDPFRWTATGGFAALPPAAAGSVPAGGQYEVLGVSPDGATAFGTYTVAGAPVVVVRWQGGAAEPLFTLPDPGDKVTAFSRDGSTLLGETAAGQAFVRPLSGGASTTLPIPAIEQTSAISADGAVVAGLFPSQTSDNQAVRAFVWSAGKGLQTLPDHTVITGVTPNGIVAGYLTGTSPQPDLDLVWDAKHGVRALRDILASHGVTVPADVTVFVTYAISDDARVIVSFCTDAADPDSMHLCRAVLPANAFE